MTKAVNLVGNCRKGGREGWGGNKEQVGYYVELFMLYLCSQPTAVNYLQKSKAPSGNTSVTRSTW